MECTIDCGCTPPLYYRINAKQPLCLNHFKALVHHRCRVYRDFSPHFPIWMTQCFIFGHMLQFFLSFRSKRSSRSCQYQFGNCRHFFANEDTDKWHHVPNQPDTNCTPCRFTSSDTSSPATTRVSLLARAMSLPAFMAFIVGSRPL